MPIGKAPGYDSASNKHFKYTNEKLRVLMSLLYCSRFFTGCYDDYNHRQSFKNEAGNLSDNNSYQPIALATIASKLFELLILSRVYTFLTTCVNQFGFKQHHSTEMLIFY